MGKANFAPPALRLYESSPPTIFDQGKIRLQISDLSSNCDVGDRIANTLSGHVGSPEASFVFPFVLNSLFPIPPPPPPCLNQGHRDHIDHDRLPQGRSAGIAASPLFFRLCSFPFHSVFGSRVVFCLLGTYLISPLPVRLALPAKRDWLSPYCMIPRSIDQQIAIWDPYCGSQRKRWKKWTLGERWKTPCILPNEPDRRTYGMTLMVATSPSLTIDFD